MMFDSQNTSQQNKKTFVFENELTSQSTIAYLKISIDGPYTDIKPILDQFYPIQRYKISLFNCFQNRFTPLEQLNVNQPAMVPSQFLQFGFIMIRYKRIQSRQNHQKSSDFMVDQNSVNSMSKKDRSKERTIGQVIQLVKNWRKLHSSTSLKKLNLQEAAKTVGVSKKSLDDYYYQLRVGEKYEYDFQQHLNDKIGHLRKFIKSRKPEKALKHRNSKHPKRLKIIEDEISLIKQEQEKVFRLHQDNFLPAENPATRNTQSQNDRYFLDSSSMALEKNLDIIQNCYYDCFNLDNFLDQDNDPYFYTGDFRNKESFNFGSDSDIIF